ncbi:hypothetical protein D3C87_2148140 [compost metagenome]
MPVVPGSHDDVFEVGPIVPPDLVPDRERQRSLRADLPVECLMLPDLGNAVVVFEIPVERQLVVNP